MPVKITTYNYNYGTYDNFKANLISNKLARNRWGKKFAKLYKKHSPLETTSPTYDFTSGMRSVTGNLSVYENRLTEYEELKVLLEKNLKVKDAGGTFSFIEAVKSSFFTVSLEGVNQAGECYINCLEFKCLALACVLSSQFAEPDGRLTSYVSVDVPNGSANVPVKLEPLENATDLYGLRIYADKEYGHYSGNGIKALNYTDSLTAYTVDNKTDAHFNINQEALFTELWGTKDILNPIGSSLGKYIFNMAIESEAVHKDSVKVGDKFNVMFSLGQVIDDLTDAIELLEKSVENEKNNNARASDDIKLIEHLSMKKTLEKEIEAPHKIRDIWYKLEKKLENPKVINTSTNPAFNNWELDPTWEWWKEDAFKDINKNFKKFREHIVVNISTNNDWGVGEVVDGVTVEVKVSALDLAGWKLFWLVSTFLDIGVRAKKASFLKRLFSVAMLVFAIYMIVVSGNPTWLKIILVTTTVLSHFGVLSPKVQLAVAILTFSYANLTANFASMSSMEMFKFAVSNINMISGMLELYENIKLEDATAKAGDKPVHELQNETVEYIYTDGYSQYDDMYNLVYDYSPNYK